ncbi:hypothetical protein [Hyphomicrobium sp. MC8b]|uniref:hypothetical protein n=1 Tax=Hyphomicrobium sp. MC8b TaxID=300273 RepID=UPI00391D81BA
MSIEVPLLVAANDDTARWEKKRVEAFNLLAPTALSFIATDGPVSITIWNGSEAVRRIGHNRGVWPAKLLKGTGRGDPAKRTYRTYAAPARTQFRIWTRTKAERDRLAEPALELIAQASEREGGLDELDDGFRDLGPDLNFEMFELEIHALARELKVFCWDDAGLIAFLDRVVKRAEEIAATSRGGRYDPIEVAMAREFERK